jgi:deoxyribodipyrimidine photo-lyase
MPPAPPRPHPAACPPPPHGPQEDLAMGPAAHKARLGGGFRAEWVPGEAGAAARLEAFLPRAHA